MSRENPLLTRVLVLNLIYIASLKNDNIAKLKRMIAHQMIVDRSGEDTPINVSDENPKSLLLMAYLDALTGSDSIKPKVGRDIKCPWVAPVHILCVRKYRHIRKHNKPLLAGYTHV